MVIISGMQLLGVCGLPGLPHTVFTGWGEEARGGGPRPLVIGVQPVRGPHSLEVEAWDMMMNACFAFGG